MASLVAVKLSYQRVGTQPPVYVAGSFSEPPWQPVEMDQSMYNHREHHFTKEVMVPQGAEIQYKFRLGSAEDWVLDETAPTGTHPPSLKARLGILINIESEILSPLYSGRCGRKCKQSPQSARWTRRSTMCHLPSHQAGEESSGIKRPLYTPDGAYCCRSGRLGNVS
jgi:hypothetical protein